MHQVLAGVRVLDFGRYIAGPFCAALLGDLGADVIRIEKVRGSEDRFIAPVTPTGEGGMFLQMNRNKRCMTLNPMKPAGRRIVRKLVATADVVVANLPPATLEAMGLDLESLREVKEDVILTTVSAYGRGGPYSDRVGFDGIGQVMSGIAYMTGDPDRPRRAAAPFVDFGTALSCAYGTLAALMARQQTGKGQMVEGALLKTALMMGNSNLIEQAVIQRDRQPTGNRGQTSAPSDLYQTADGWVLCSVIGEPLFRRWVELIASDNGGGARGEEIDWLNDPRFADDLARGDNAGPIGERMNAWCASRSTAEAVDALNGAMIPSAPAYSMQQTLDDPHIAEVESFVDLEYPGMARPAPVARPSVRLTETPATIRHRAPILGEHTDEILGNLGYSNDEIAAFRAERVV